jgi:DNA-binding PucR family transcriptional regulator
MTENDPGDVDTPFQTPAFDAEELAAALEEAFEGDSAEHRVVARQARDLADAGIAAADRGTPLTVEEIVRNLRDAPPESSVADRWNWWLGALEAAYGGYREFEVRAVPKEQEKEK